VLDVALHVERTGWDRIDFADHFMPDGREAGAPALEAWTTLAALGARVPRVEIATLVTGNTCGPPAVLAKMAATLDHITGSRAVLGLGPGGRRTSTGLMGSSSSTPPPPDRSPG